ncbi:hypothetical protein KQX54_015393 [Cotesia glomerata]|uniref:Uncharacterized protein n=1 Tax=Cotesia glomerata TaxID=32391 RepID=A0AAV7J567_COTGL|nr:hypothetical protein KQX54_015393 [Cotesia glomerata]
MSLMLDVTNNKTTTDLDKRPNLRSEGQQTVIAYCSERTNYSQNLIFNLWLLQVIILKKIHKLLPVIVHPDDVHLVLGPAGLVADVVDPGGASPSNRPGEDAAEI